MEVYKPSNVTFMRRYARYEPIVQDHSAVIQAKTCARKYFLRIVLGFVPRQTPQYFGFGSCYHKFREILEKSWMKLDEADKLKEEAMMACFGVAMNEARALWKRKKMTDPPPGDKWDFMTEARLVASCAHAYKHWKAEKEKGRIKVLAIEQNFIVPLPDGTLVAGKCDQIVMWNGKVYGRDFKTSSKTQDAYFVRTLDPNDQFTRYTWAESELSGQDVEGQMVEVLFNAKSTKKEQKGPSIHNHLTTRSKDQLERWVKEQVFYNKILTIMREEDTYPMEEKHCPFCEFHSVCSKGTEQAMMNKLESEFKVEPWDCVNRADMLDD